MSPLMRMKIKAAIAGNNREIVLRNQQQIINMVTTAAQQRTPDSQTIVRVGLSLVAGSTAYTIMDNNPVAGIAAAVGCFIVIS